MPDKFNLKTASKLYCWNI